MAGFAFACLAECFQIDGVANNVGMVSPQSLDEVTLEKLAQVMQVNLYPAIIAIQAALPGMKARRWAPKAPAR